MNLGFLRINLETIIPQIIALLITIVLHELGHGYTALLMGDKTAKNSGRLTLNPLKHLDPLGVLCMFVFKFGWAKPVPINSFNFYHRRLGMFLVSISGITVNMLLAFFSMAGLIYFQSIHFLRLFFQMMVLYNVFFALFNVLPLPPLDGSKILASIFPERIMYRLLDKERYFYIILMILIFTNIIPKLLSPIADRITMQIFAFWQMVLGV